MTTDLNPQREQMADESMVRNLAGQAEAIWPQEEPLFRRYGLAEDIRILDAGCGTGEVSSRLATLYRKSTVLGVDIIESHLELARRRFAAFGERLRFEHRDLFALGLPERSFDLVVCRHVVQAIPDAPKVFGELVRVTRPGGRLHVIAEDYGMIFFPEEALDPSVFWHEGPVQFGRSTGTDLHVGRRAWSHLRALGLRDLTVDYLVVDTVRVSRNTFAAIWEAWRDGYAEAISKHTRFSLQEARAYFDQMIATIRDETKYAAWIVPVVAGIVP